MCVCHACCRNQSVTCALTAGPGCWLRAPLTGYVAPKLRPPSPPAAMLLCNANRLPHTLHAHILCLSLCICVCVCLPFPPPTHTHPHTTLGCARVVHAVCIAAPSHAAAQPRNHSACLFACLKPPCNMRQGMYVPFVSRAQTTHPLTLSLYLSLSLSLTHSLTHSLTPSFTHSLTPSLPHSLTPSLPHSLTPSLPHSYIHACIHWMTTGKLGWVLRSLS